MSLIILTVAAFFTSLLAGVLGQGGGLILLPILAGFVPANTIIPVHGFIQAASNGSRAYLAKKHVHWGIIKKVAIGCVLGSLIVLPIIKYVDWNWVMAGIGIFILINLWGQSIRVSPRLPLPFYLLGLFQGSLGMIVGATGPLGNSLLFSAGLTKEAIIATNAIIMLISHVLKVILFTAIGFQFFHLWPLLLSLCLASIAGSYIGTRIRVNINEALFLKFFKIILTLLAIRMIALPLFFGD